MIISLNGDDDKLITVREAKGIRPVFFGIKNHQDIWADEIQPEGLKGISCRIHAGEESFSVLIPIPDIIWIQCSCRNCCRADLRTDFGGNQGRH